MNSALLYVRVSSKEQEKEGYSLDAQEKLGHEYAVKRNMPIVRTWKVAESAWNTKKDRRAFIQMIEYSKAHPEIGNIIFDITDRMTRNDFDKIKIIDLIQIHNKTIHFSRSNKIYNRSSSPDDIFMLDIEVAVAKKMSGDISRKVKMGLQEKAEQGIYPSTAPLGYINNEKTRHVDINEPQAQYLRTAFQLMATGNYSIEMLVRHLNDSGFLSNNSIKIRKSTLAHILKNPFYYGVFNWKGKQYPGSHEPLISKTTFDRVQRVLSGKRHPHIHRKDFAFNNLLTCGICDCKVLGEEKRKPNGNRYIYYHCTFSKGRHEKKGYISENRLMGLFEEPVRQVSTISQEMAEWIKEGLTIRAQNAQQSHNNHLVTLQTQHTKVSHRLNKLFDDRLDGKVADETFARAKEVEYVTELNDLKYKIEEAKKRNPNFYETGVKTLELINLLYSQYLMADPHEKAVILKRIASNYTLNDATPCPTYKKPFSIFAKRASCPTWLPRMDSNHDTEIQNLVSYH